MLQALDERMAAYHSLFSGGGCKGWQLEESIVKAIQADTSARHNVFWQEAGADDKADITVTVDGKTYLLQVKTGKVMGGRLNLSGYRLGRFHGDLDKITQYLNERSNFIVSAAYTKIDDDRGRTHKYEIRYIEPEMIGDLDPKSWISKGKAGMLVQTNGFGVEASLRPSMSWQVWWSIPTDALPPIRIITVG